MDRSRVLIGFRSPRPSPVARLIRVVGVLLLACALLPAFGGAVNAATAPALTRYPYLTDSIQSSITLNWATDQSSTTATGSVKWGPVSAGCANPSTTTTAATKTGSFTVGTLTRFQWKAVLPVSPDTQYCYRVFFGTTDLLGTDASPQFTSQVRVNTATPFSFAVFGDWGQAYAGGVNADQTNLLTQMAQSGSRFAVMTGDTAYPGGGQTEYGDLQQAGMDISTIFGPTFWPVPGKSLPVFNVVGNHGFTAGAVQLLNWPEENAAAASGGKYLMEQYPSINGSAARSYPSAWYAVDAGTTRLYMLTAAWADSNIGTGSVYQNDRDAHWLPGSPQYQWLKADLEAHPNAVKIAFWHYPLFADSSSQPSDTFLQGGTGTLQGLLNQNNVALVFNGHAHGYERNVPDAAGMVTHVVGNGGAALGRVSGCSAFDAYAIGSSASHCGAAPAPTSNAEVFGFVKVTVNNRQVTVTPTSSTGRTYDIQTYNVPGNEVDATPPSVPGALTATSPAQRGQVNLSWNASTDNVGVTGYRIYRNGQFLTSPTGTGTSFTDLTVAPASTYTYQVTAIDAAGNESAQQTTAASVTTTGPADTAPPTQPGNLTASAPASNTVNLSWTASSDDVRVLGYKVYRNSTLLKQTPFVDDATTFQDQDAAPGTTYTYQVEAVDAAGNPSTKASVTVTTPASTPATTLTFQATDDASIDFTAPTVNAGSANRLTVDSSPVNDFLVKFTVAGTGSGTSCPQIASAKMRLTVGSGGTDNSPAGGAFRGTANTPWSESTVNWNNAPAPAGGGPLDSITTPVALNTAYLVDVTPLVTGNNTFTIRASGNSSDGARYFSRNGNAATVAPQLQVTCAAATPDTTPPSRPGTPTQTAVTTSTVSMSWTASTDNVGVTGYRIFRNGAPVLDVGGTTLSYQDTGLAGGTQYRYTIKAFDGVGNLSAESGALLATTTAGETTPPTTPVLTAGTATTTTVPLTWTTSTDASGVKNYEVYRDGGTTPISTPTTTNFTDTGLTPGTTHTYTVKAVDNPGNKSAASNTISATTTGSAGGTRTFPVTADATIVESTSTVNAGSATRITIDTSPVNQFLMKFEVVGTGAGTTCPTIASAKLRLTVGNATDDNSPRGGEFRRAADTPAWTEGGVNWGNAPAAISTPVSSMTTAVALSTAYLIDVTPLVTGNGPTTIRASGLSSDGARYFSKEGGASTQAPELQITCG